MSSAVLSDSKIEQITLVVLQFVTAATLVLTSARGVLANPGWLGMILPGAVLGIWSWVTFGLRKITVMPDLGEHAALVTTGPYQFVRHPMYSAVLIFCGGFVFCRLTWWKVLLWLVLLGVVWTKSQMEERFLQERFPEYQSYRKRTGRFIPKLIPQIPTNREHN